MTYAVIGPIDGSIMNPVELISLLHIPISDDLSNVKINDDGSMYVDLPQTGLNLDINGYHISETTIQTMTSPQVRVTIWYSLMSTVQIRATSQMQVVIIYSVVVVITMERQAVMVFLTSIMVCI